MKAAGGDGRRWALLRQIVDAPWHPIGFAAAWVLNAWINVAISPFAMFRALVTAIVAAMAITLLGWLIFRDLRRSALVASAIVAFVVLGREVAVIVRNAVDLLPTWQTVIVAFAFASACATVGFIWWRRFRRTSGSGSSWRGLNVMGAWLCLC